MDLEVLKSDRTPLDDKLMEFVMNYDLSNQVFYKEISNVSIFSV